MGRLTAMLLGVVSIFAASSTLASAKVICNEDGDCWKVKKYREYPADLKLRVYEDDWHWSDGESHRYRWRDHDHDRHGYYRSGVWIDLN